MARDCQSGGSARVEQTSDLADSVKADHVVHEIQTRAHHSLPPTWSQLETALADDRLIGEDEARSWIAIALMCGRIHETADERLALVGGVTSR